MIVNETRYRESRTIRFSTDMEAYEYKDANPDEIIGDVYFMGSTPCLDIKNNCVPIDKKETILQPKDYIVYGYSESYNKTVYARNSGQGIAFRECDCSFYTEEQANSKIRILSTKDACQCSNWKKKKRTSC